MFPPNQPWHPKLNWETPAGKCLKGFLAKISTPHELTIIIFGSTPLQLGVEPSLISGDIDIISPYDFSEFLEREGLAKSGYGNIYIDQCAENVFVAGTTWRERAFSEKHGLITLIFPHPIDILVSKIRRLEEKDLRAFKVVLEKTGHPTEEELTKALKSVVDIYRPAFDEENPGGAPVANTERVWREIYGKSIDVRRHIIEPALEERNRGSGGNTPDYKKRLMLL